MTSLVKKSNRKEVYVQDIKVNILKNERKYSDFFIKC